MDEPLASLDAPRKAESCTGPSLAVQLNRIDALFADAQPGLSIILRLSHRRCALGLPQRDPERHLAPVIYSEIQCSPGWEPLQVLSAGTRFGGPANWDEFTC
jgi:hypothetical protein